MLDPVCLGEGDRGDGVALAPDGPGLLEEGDIFVNPLLNDGRNRGAKRRRSKRKMTSSSGTWKKQVVSLLRRKA
ncbi:MAG: hypothetical protein RMJ98_03955 [Myxococcales bacterium]|nr:hypothetical protein [Polyangiaceae bacterium]MDW8248443.1 hypothetical protein [Myxococcales bacterium]